MAFYMVYESASGYGIFKLGAFASYDSALDPFNLCNAISKEDEPMAAANDEEPKSEKKKKKKKEKRKQEDEDEEMADVNGVEAEDGTAKKKKSKTKHEE